MKNYNRQNSGLILVRIPNQNKNAWRNYIHDTTWRYGIHPIKRIFDLLINHLNLDHGNP
jgi:hypothetical protein